MGNSPPRLSLPSGGFRQAVAGRMGGFLFSMFFPLLQTLPPRARTHSGLDPGEMTSAPLPVRQALGGDAGQRQEEAEIPRLPEHLQLREGGHTAGHGRLGQGAEREQRPRGLGRRQVCRIVAHPQPENGVQTAESPLREFPFLGVPCRLAPGPHTPGRGPSVPHRVGVTKKVAQGEPGVGAIQRGHWQILAIPCQGREVGVGTGVGRGGGEE